jgi:hypothetical protein
MNDRCEEKLRLLSNDSFYTLPQLIAFGLPAELATNVSSKEYTSVPQSQ